MGGFGKEKSDSFLWETNYSREKKITLSEQDSGIIRLEMTRRHTKSL